MSYLRPRPRVILGNRRAWPKLRRNYTIQENDRVLFNGYDENSLLSQPLQQQGVTRSRWGTIAHSQVIGETGRQRVTTDKGKEVTFQVPTLSEYVTLTPRMVTPVYPADANFIVSLLDIHASPDGSDEGTLEILEAGTGHGSLTLHLARAIHAANASESESQSPSNGPSSRSALILQAVQSVNPFRARSQTSSNRALSLPAQRHCRSRIHTVDVSAQFSDHAKKIVNGFRHGVYSEDVSFYVAKVSEWLDQQIIERGLEDCDDKTFLDHIVLDMPDSYRQVEKATSTLRSNGSLLLFNPSITQIIAAAELIRTKKLPLFLERVIELGPFLTGGKEWDVRAVKPRALLQAEHEQKLARRNKQEDKIGQIGDQMSSNEISAGVLARDSEQSQATADNTQGFQMVCRPKAFARLVGGGFVGVWKKRIPARKR